MPADVSVLISGYDSPEGPAFDQEGNLFFVNWLSSSIVKLTPDGVASEFFNTGGIPAGRAVHHVHAAAGSRPQAALLLQEHHADRAAAV